MRRTLLLITLLILIFGLISCTVPDENSLYITLNPGIDTIGIDEEHVDAGAKAKYGFKLLDVEVVENTVDVTTVGTYQIVYRSVYLEYENSIIRYVTVVDNHPPLVSINPGIDTIFIGSSWIDAGVSVADDSGTPVTISIDGTVNIWIADEYEIVYEVTDQSGNKTIVTRFVNVLPTR